MSSHEYEQAAGRSRTQGDDGTPSPEAAPEAAPGPATAAVEAAVRAGTEPEPEGEGEVPRSGVARVIALRPGKGAMTPGAGEQRRAGQREAGLPQTGRPQTGQREAGQPQAGEREAREPLWRHLVGAVLRRERVAQQRTLKDVAEAARISMPYLSEVERGRKEASSEVLAAAAHALGLGLSDVLTRVQSELARPARVARTARSAGLARPVHPGNGAPRSLGARPAAPHQGEVRLAA